MNKQAVIHIIDSLGAEIFEERFGVGSHSIRNYRTTGIFPASLFDGVEELCREKGIPCPRDAFGWKKPAKKIGAPLECFKAAEG